PTHPELSLALIDQPGKGFRWIRQSAEVGHLVIEQIKDGSIVVRDGEKIFELVAKRPEKRSLLKKPATDQTGAGSASTSSTRNKAGTAEDILPPVPEDTAAFMEKLIVELEQMQLKAEEIEQELDDANGNDMDVLGKMISELKTMKISPEEARQLDDLGRQLQVLVCQLSWRILMRASWIFDPVEDSGTLQRLWPVLQGANPEPESRPFFCLCFF
ncbi:MAG: hypothetical protein ACYSRZ_08705, partial [Planctomycetota bacterium]